MAQSNAFRPARQPSQLILGALRSLLAKLQPNADCEAAVPDRLTRQLELERRPLIPSGSCVNQEPLSLFYGITYHTI
jgi:hypothetical protein